jgi:hypothetical protein
MTDKTLEMVIEECWHSLMCNSKFSSLNEQDYEKYKMDKIIFTHTVLVAVRAFYAEKLLADDFIYNLLMKQYPVWFREHDEHKTHLQVFCRETATAISAKVRGV